MDPTAPNTSSMSNTGGTLPEHNETLLTRDMILTLLADLSSRILSIFQRPIRLVVHGGAAMLLHPGLYAKPGCRRRDTRDIDYIHRAFVEEWRQLGFLDAGERLQCCINATARKFNLGKDWMNAHADVALPMANDPQGRRYDPIYTASVKPNNVHLHTLYNSPGLVLISVTPFWAVALKLVRYQKHDPADITAILRNGTRLNGVQWSAEVLERWLRTECWPMGYENYPDWLKRDMCERIAHAVAQLKADPPSNALTRPPSIEILQPEQHQPTRSHSHPIMSFSTTSYHRPRSSLEMPVMHQQHSTTHPESTHHRLARPASMTFPPPTNPQLAVLPPPPPHQHHPQSISRTHSMPLPLSLSIPQQQHLVPHTLSTSPQSAGLTSAHTVVHPVPSPGLLAPPYHFSQSPTTVHHIPQSQTQSMPQPQTHSHKPSHLGFVWPSGHRQAMLPPVPHGMNWPGQLIITA